MSKRSRTVFLSENVRLADFLCVKREEFLSSENPRLAKTVDRAFISVCENPTAILDLHDAKKLKNIGPWILKQMKPFFDGVDDSHSFDEDDQQDSGPVEAALQDRGKKERKKKAYCPRVCSAPYALLITLLRGHRSGKEFMRKQELIDATEASGLSDGPIGSNAIPSNGMPDPRGFYSGWSSMATLTRKCLVVRSSNPAKYMLTEEGRRAAQECLDRSGFTEGNSSGHELAREEVVRAVPSANSMQSARPNKRRKKDSGLHSGNSLGNGSRREEVVTTDPVLRERSRPNSARKENPDSDDDLQEIGSTAFRPNQIDNTSSQRSLSNSPQAVSPPVVRRQEPPARAESMHLSRNDSASNHSLDLQTMSHIDIHVTAPSGVISRDPGEALAVPPLDHGEKFSDAYEIVCLVDQREKFRVRGADLNDQLDKFIANLASQFKIKVKKRQLPVGDVLWVARHKRKGVEYVLDFVVERKRVDDLWQSVKDKRYKQQKLRLKHCGLKRVTYLVEGDVNSVEATDSVKTAMFTTELQGFHMLRTSDSSHTLRQYGQLTESIINRFNVEVGERGASGNVCKTFEEFRAHIKEFDKDRVSDVFCLQLAQINHVTEDIALSIMDRYSTLFSLVQAYSMLEGNQDAQEKLLQGIVIRNSSKVITATISKNVYKVIWAP